MKPILCLTIAASIVAGDIFARGCGVELGRRPQQITQGPEYAASKANAAAFVM